MKIRRETKSIFHPLTSWMTISKRLWTSLGLIVLIGCFNSAEQAFAKDLKAGDSLGEVVTITGEKYSACTLVKLEPDGITVFHSTGIAKISFEELSERMKTSFGYDPAKAAAFVQEQERRAQEAFNRRMEKAKTSEAEAMNKNNSQPNLQEELERWKKMKREREEHEQQQRGKLQQLLSERQQEQEAEKEKRMEANEKTRERIRSRGNPQPAPE